MFGKKIQKWWCNITGKDLQIQIGDSLRVGHQSRISINGDVVGGKIFVNGVEQEGMVATPKIDIQITGGTVHHVETSQNLTCGNVTGNAKAGLDLRCGNIGGNADAGMSIEAQDIGGDADSGMEIKARDIKGDADAGMNIKANSIGGRAKSAF